MRTTFRGLAGLLVICLGLSATTVQAAFWPFRRNTAEQAVPTQGAYGGQYVAPGNQGAAPGGYTGTPANYAGTPANYAGAPANYAGAPNGYTRPQGGYAVPTGRSASPAMFAGRQQQYAVRQAAAAAPAQVPAEKSDGFLQSAKGMWPFRKASATADAGAQPTAHLASARKVAAPVRQASAQMPDGGGAPAPIADGGYEGGGAAPGGCASGDCGSGGGCCGEGGCAYGLFGTAPDFGASNCQCNGSYKFPVPPLYTYHWPGMYSMQLMTDYHSPWRFPALKPYVDEPPVEQIHGQTVQMQVPFPAPAGYAWMTPAAGQAPVMVPVQNAPQGYAMAPTYPVPSPYAVPQPYAAQSPYVVPQQVPGGAAMPNVAWAPYAAQVVAPPTGAATPPSTPVTPGATSSRGGSVSASKLAERMYGK